MFKFFTEKKLEEAMKKEYARGVIDTCEKFKHQELSIAQDKLRIQGEWEAFRKERAEFDNKKATLILDGIKDIFAQVKPVMPDDFPRPSRWY